MLIREPSASLAGAAPSQTASGCHAAGSRWPEIHYAASRTPRVSGFWAPTEQGLHRPDFSDIMAGNKRTTAGATHPICLTSSARRASGSLCQAPCTLPDAIE